MMNMQQLFDRFGLKPAKNDARYAWVDYAKGIAIILVVYRHLGYGLLASHVFLPPVVIASNDMLYSFRMPLFFLLSGLFFSKSLMKRGKRDFALTKINTLLYPYLLWAIIQISLQIMFFRFANSNRSAIDYLNIFIQPRKLDQLWYLFALFNVTMLYLFTSLIIKGKKIWQLLIGLILLGIAPYVRSISTFYDITLHYIFFALGDIAAGFFFRETLQQGFSNLRNLLLLAPFFSLLQWYYLYHQEMNLYLFLLIALNGCLFVILLASWLARIKKMGFLSVIGHYSLYIYLLHVSIDACLRTVLHTLGITNGIELMVIIIPTSIFLSIVVYRACLLAGLSFLFTGRLGEKTSTANISAI